MGLATVHSNNASDAIDRIITLIKRDPLNAQYEEKFIRQLLFKYINYIVYMEDYKISEIIKLEYDNKFSIKLIYKYVKTNKNLSDDDSDIYEDLGIFKRINI